MCARASTDPDARRQAERAAARLGRRSPLRERFTAERWRHTLGVAETAYRLAAGLGWSARERDRALLAGLLHDVAKGLPREGQRALVGLPGAAPGTSPADPEAFTGPLLHARAGAILTKREYGVTDERVLEAIAFHPTGTSGRAPLAKLLFVADFLEPGRPHVTGEDRALLERGLAGAVPLAELYCAVLDRKLGHVRARGLEVHPWSLAAWRAHCGGRG